MSRHSYVYGHSNPVNFTDPSGFMTLMELKVAEKIGFEINATTQVASLAKIATQANLAIRIYEAAGVSIAATTAIGLADTLAPIIGLNLSEIKRETEKRALASIPRDVYQPVLQ